MEPSELVIHATGLKKSFDDKQVLNGVDLKIPRGAIVGLIGTNGAGKSTLLKCLLGLLKISNGSAKVYGEDPWDLSVATKAKLGYVPQVVKFYPWMKVQQMVDYTAAHYENWDHQTSDLMLKNFDLKSTDTVKVLSTGQQQRLGLVLAMGFHPELLILDEPAASLDPAGRRTLLRSLLEHSQNDQQTALFSTHITSDLERVASHVAILRNGVIEFFGELEDLKDSVKRLRISSDSDLPRDFTVPSALRSEIHGSTAVVSVSAADTELISRLEQHWNVQVTIEDLNLEDIFLELHDEQE
ncbi:MAG: ABC transporter ATP-binding protein [Fuerstiella sp.]